MKSKFLLLFLSLFMVVGGVKAEKVDVKIVGGANTQSGTATWQAESGETYNGPVSLKLKGKEVTGTFTISVPSSYVIDSYKATFDSKTTGAIFTVTLEGKTGVNVTNAGGNTQIGSKDNINNSASSFTVKQSGTWAVVTTIGNKDGELELTDITVNFHHVNHTFSEGFCSVCNALDESKIAKASELNGNMLYTEIDGHQKALTSSENLAFGTENEIMNLNFNQISATTDNYVKVSTGNKYLNYNSTKLEWLDGNLYLSLYFVKVLGNGYKIVDKNKKTKALGVSNGQLAYVDVADAATFYLADTKANLSCKAKTADATAYGTFVAPFDVTLPSGVKAWKVTGVEHSVVAMEDACNGSNQLAANTAVVLENSGANAVGEWVYGISKGTHNQNSGSFLVGLYPDNLIVPVNAYVLQTPEGGKQMFYKMETAAEGVANRCYLAAGNYEVNAMSLSFDEVDAVEAVEALVSSKSQIYDITGRKLDRLQKGINIVNGKKIMVK